MSGRHAAAMSLASDGAQWCGTFGMTVEFLARDLLSDGYPVGGVSVCTADGDTISGTLTDVHDGRLLIGGRSIEIHDNITRLTVA